MARYRYQSFFDTPHAVTYLLLLLNSAMFAVCLLGNSLVKIDAATLYHYGALYQGVIAKQEYWRFIAYSFLHANALHLLTNMICLVLWSGILEKRVGATYFLLIYIAAAIGGGVASFYGHHTAFLTVGASGAISGVAGALLCLTMLGKLQIPPQFFIVNIGLNVMLMTRVTGIDWLAHLGGFTAGMAVCAILDGVETLNKYWLRCKFPEFVKFSITILISGACLIYIPEKSAFEDGQAALPQVAAFALTVILIIKATDLLLGQSKGLAVVVIASAAVCSSLPLLLGTTLQQAMSGACINMSSMPLIKLSGEVNTITDAVCARAALAPVILAVSLFCIILLILRTELWRGLKDVGFVANTFRAERNRRSGL